MDKNNNYCNYFAVIKNLTKTSSQAFFLEKIVGMYKYSKYDLEGVKYFTRTRAQFVDEFGLSEKTISNYLKFLEGEGLIERVNRLMGSKKRLYIRITDKLSRLLGIIQSTPSHPVNHHQKIQPEGKEKTIDNECSFLSQNYHTDPVNFSETNINNNSNSIVNSTVNDVVIVGNSKKEGLPKPSCSNNTQTKPISEKLIGERITDRLKNYIHGMIKNLQVQHELKLSSPDQLFAEVVFSVLNKEQFEGINNPHHRVNIIAKLLREGRWRTPKGFYNHWDVGTYFKKKTLLKEAEHQAHKTGEGRGQILMDESASIEAPSAFLRKTSKPQTNQYQERRQSNKLKAMFNELCGEIASEERYIHQLQSGFKGKVTDATQKLIDSLAIKVASLYEKKSELETKLNFGFA